MGWAAGEKGSRKRGLGFRFLWVFFSFENFLLFLLFYKIVCKIISNRDISK
jgi:hypothetical protein